MTAEALVLDFGGVVSKTMFETHNITEQALGLPAGSLTWEGPFAEDGDDELWSRMQNGDISERDYWSARTFEVGAMVGQKWTAMQDFIKAARGARIDDCLRPEALAAIAAAKAGGKRLAVLSNELDLFYGSDFREKIAVLADFELIVDATYTQILKPDPRAYGFITDGLGLTADQCVFVDDQAKNIRGSEDVGMQSVWFDVRAPRESYNQALALLGLGPL